MWAVNSGEVRGEVGTISHMCYCRMGGVGTWVLLLYAMSRLM